MVIHVPLLENVAGELDVISDAEYCLLPFFVVMVSVCAVVDNVTSREAMMRNIIFFISQILSCFPYLF